MSNKVFIFLAIVIAIASFIGGYRSYTPDHPVLQAYPAVGKVTT